MNRLFSATIIVITAILLSCSKSKKSNITHINCDGLVTDTLGTNDDGRIYMPNAFSPNNDGLNDICRPITQNIISIEFTVYDENNNVVFTTNQPGQGWQPVTGANAATKFYYKIQAVTSNNRKIGQCGEVYRLTCIPDNIPVVLLFEDELTPNGWTLPSREILPNCR